MGDHTPAETSPQPAPAALLHSEIAFVPPGKTSPSTMPLILLPPPTKRAPVRSPRHKAARAASPKVHSREWLSPARFHTRLAPPCCLWAAARQTSPQPSGDQLLALPG